MTATSDRILSERIELDREFARKMTEPEPGDCRDCGEPLNDAEGDYCPECRANRGAA